ncbi:MAG: ribonuclease J, partial [Paracoccaceae bacterium]|nr:ribonuclease J [Paracoccaceae bacterium]
TATIAKMKMTDQGHPAEAVNVVGPLPDVVEAGPFRVQFAPVSHSIPESSALIIDTPAGRIVHSGDFKLDPDPVVGEAYDPEASADVAEAGVKVLVCDSTNVFNTHAGRSESSIGPAIRELVESSTGMFVATTFASNIARLKTLAEAGRAAGRSVCLLGRAMKRMVTAAEEAGVLTDFPPIVPPEMAADIPRQHLMLIVTGSQGERRAATAQLSRGKYLGLEMKEGDTFLFSSKTIPGNERGVIRIMNALSEMGVNLVDDQGGRYHVSGHANRPDLERVHAAMKPSILIPMHGEHRHLREHSRIAAAKGIASDVVTNGMMVDLTGDAPEVVEFIETGRTYLDGTAQVGAFDGVIRDRIRMAMNGLVLVTLIVDEDGIPLGEPWAECLGLPLKGRNGRVLLGVIEADLAEFLDRADRHTLADDDKLDEGIRRVVRQVSMEEVGKKPEVTVVVSRLGEDD